MREKLERGMGLFDFDGTLVPWDTQGLFADFVLKREPRRAWYLPVFAAFLPCAKILGDEGLKRVFLNYLWRAKCEQVQDWAREFAEQLVPAMCYQGVLDSLKQHRDAGHLTVMSSASPEFYVKEFGRVLGFDLALGTVVECEGKMRFFPDLQNHKGQEKVERLRAIIGLPEGGVWSNSHGYTDSSADLPMMRCCERGTLVNPSKRLTEIGEQKGWKIVRPEVPWEGKLDKSLQILRFITGKS